MSPFLHRLRSKSSFHTTSSSSPSSSSSHSSNITRTPTPDTSAQPKKLVKHRRNPSQLISILVETEVVTECYRCGPGKGHSHGEQCFNDEVILIERSSSNNKRNAPNDPSPANKTVRGMASHSYLRDWQTERRMARSQSPFNRHQGFDPVLQEEYRKLMESRAKLESIVNQHTDPFHGQGRRVNILAEEGANIRRCVTPETELQQNRTQFTPRRSDEASPSSARRACQQAYAKMTPAQRYLMREKLHRDGIRRRDFKREEEERVDWERYQKTAPRPLPEEQANRSVPKLQEDAVLLKEEKTELFNGWETYENSWKQLGVILSSMSIITDHPHAVPKLTFNLIPWPVSEIFITLPDSNPKLTNDTLFNTIFSTETISTFLFSPHHSDQKSKRQRLRDALLHYHPDRFENYVLCSIEENETTVTKLAMSRVARVLNSMLSDC
ncbi:hypothetical protein Clacol_004314 [Clathrus columnatus]|uniref:Uncharacterized protein n=1 Tax=Clathrus columnatus TaxID=1419009 RepID=A0AAV5AA85_9AGAM|nr:hypothetical protein Clacol_004314 [Clathrus columnatus]